MLRMVPLPIEDGEDGSVTFLLELRSEEIPARMQPAARAELERLFRAQAEAAGLAVHAVRTLSTPRRLALIADLAEASEGSSEERKGPRADAPDKAIDGFLRSTGLTRDQLEEREVKGAAVLFAVTHKPARPAADVLAEAIPAIVRDFAWPKSMRWGAASTSTESLRWVRPLHGIVALLDGEVVPCEVAGIASGRETRGHRFHAPGPLSIDSAESYEAQLRAAHVIAEPDERRRIIAEGAERLAADAGLALVADEGLVTENVGLTEWPVPLIGRFDAASLTLPPEVIQLTARVNQKYFVTQVPPRNGEGDHAQHGGGAGSEPLHHSAVAERSPSPFRGGTDLADAFILVANIDADPTAARRSWRATRRCWPPACPTPASSGTPTWPCRWRSRRQEARPHRVPREAGHGRRQGGPRGQARPLAGGGGGHPSPGGRGREPRERRKGEGDGRRQALSPSPPAADAAPPSPEGRGHYAALAERAARLCKADLVTGTVTEFPELQGVAGGHLALAQGEDPQVAAAIRDHYKPVGPDDEVPTAPVTVAVSLADKLDTLFGFFGFDMAPTGSKDPFALRRAMLGVVALLIRNRQHVQFRALTMAAGKNHMSVFGRAHGKLLAFAADRLKVQQREAGVRHDLIDAVFALGREDDLVRLIDRTKALQRFVETDEGADLLAGYKRAVNILKKEGVADTPSSAVTPAKAGVQAPDGGRMDPRLRGDDGGEGPGSSSEPEADPLIQTGDEDPLATVDSPSVTGAVAAMPHESHDPAGDAEEVLGAALTVADYAVAEAVEKEEWANAMASLASLRAPIDRFFEHATVNDPDPAVRARRLALLVRVRDIMHRVADFSRIDG